MHQINNLLLDVERENSRLYVYLEDPLDVKNDYTTMTGYDVRFAYRLPHLVYGVSPLRVVGSYTCKFSNFVATWKKRCST